MVSIEKILSIPKSLYFCLKTLPFNQAIKIPILIRYNCKIISCHGKIEIGDKVKFASIQIGFGQVGIFDKKYSRTIIELNGKIIFQGKAGFGHGSKICVGERGILTIGNNFSNTAEGTIICFRQININDNCTTSWNTLIMDTDFHPTIDTKTLQENLESAPITIGNNTWIGTRSVILKNSRIPNGCIVGANSLINKSYDLINCLIAGNPAEIKKINITKK